MVSSVTVNDELILDFQKILTDCGDMLLSLPSSKRKQGNWCGDQFKSLADKLANDLIESRLKALFPDVPIVSEEDKSYSSLPGDAGYFLVDPIDGTASYSQGFDGWVTQICYVKDRTVMASGIYAPQMKLFYSAVLGHGAFCNGCRISTAKKDGFKSIIDNYPEPNNITRAIMRAFCIKEYLECGSIGLKMCRVADGTADLFCKDMLPRDWDVGPPMLILSEAGGCSSDIEGNQITLGSKSHEHNGLIASKNLKNLVNVVKFLGKFKN
jgi:3'(2'), 5'-bisphosphate nucleotidase